MTPWKNELMSAFSLPPPMGKRAFLRQTTGYQMTFIDFLHSQLWYIKKWVWCLAVLIVAINILGTAVLSLDMLWVIASCTPILAMTLLSETGRSERYQMDELERSTRFSLRSVILGRFAILGLTNLLVLCLLIPISLLNTTINPLAGGLYITTPFLLTVCIGLAITRTYRGQTALYGCWATAFFISISVILSHLRMPSLYHEQHILWWTFSFTALCITIKKHFAGIIQQTEELLWN